MQVLYMRARGGLHQTLVADYSIADAYRSSLTGGELPEWRPILAAMFVVWSIIRRLCGRRIGIAASVYASVLVGLPALLLAGLRLHSGGYRITGPTDANIILLRTGVANEPLIARWISDRHNLPVAVLSFNEESRSHLGSVRHFGFLIATYLRMAQQTSGTLADLVSDCPIDAVHFDKLVSYWMTLVARCAVEIAWTYSWAKLHLGQRPITHLYFTMNYARENAFFHALPGAIPAYVEHGFPRRGIPPLPCMQYTYSKGYAEYLQSFDKSLPVEIIGLEYFPSGHIVPTQTILIASLQDWPQFKIGGEVADVFNAALNAARHRGWRLVLRTRSYDADAFRCALEGPWDEISEVSVETFAACLERIRPAMVWTTWSTAVLDAAAKGIEAVAFITPSLENFFITDLHEFSLTVMPDRTGYSSLITKLDHRI